MARGSKASVEGKDLAELKVLRHDMTDSRSDELHREVGQLCVDLNSMNLKQNDVIVAVTEMNEAVGTIGTQLTAMSKAIAALRASTNVLPNNTGNTETVPDPNTTKSPTFL
jgi:hypothetical protein